MLWCHRHVGVAVADDVRERLLGYCTISEDDTKTCGMD